MKQIQDFNTNLIKIVTRKRIFVGSFGKACNNNITAVGKFYSHFFKMLIKHL